MPNISSLTMPDGIVYAIKDSQARKDVEEIKKQMSGEGGSSSVLDSLIDRSITEITNATVTSIGNGAFMYCSALTSVDLPNATSIGNDAFSRAMFTIDHALTTVNLPNATSIGSNAFEGCRALISIDIPNVTSIGSNAFGDCRTLTSIDLPNVTSIGSNAFRDISSNAVINIGAAEGEIKNAPWGAPNGVTINYDVK